MDIQTILQAITTVGFPIVCCGAMMWYVKYQTDVNREDIDKLNAHIGISHSNLEDLMLLTSIGAVWWILLISRWIMSIILVWEFRLETAIKNKFVSL